MLNVKTTNKLGGLAFQNALSHLDGEIIQKLKKSAESTGRKDLFEVYYDACRLFERFKKERRFDLALKLEAGFRPH